MKLSLIILLSITFSVYASLGRDSRTEGSQAPKSELELTPYQRVSMYMGHSLLNAKPISRQSEILWGIKAVKPVLEIATNLQDDFNAERVEQKIISVLKKKAIQIDEENGHVLLFRIRGVWDKGRINMAYTYDLDLVDAVYVSRGDQIKSNIRSVWNVSNMGFAGRDVYQNAMLINVESAIEHFSISYFEQLDFDIISDTPRLATKMYQKIRDGEADILNLVSNIDLDE